MPLFDGFAAARGAWLGTNGFRMRPTEPFGVEPFRADVTPSAGGHLLAVAYVWKHPEDDNPWDGLMLLGSDGADGLTALWGDAWHQQPAPLVMTGAIEPDGSLLVAATYSGDWGWRIAVAFQDDLLTMRMDNVVPASEATSEIAAGPYPVMQAELRRC